MPVLNNALAGAAGSGGADAGYKINKSLRLNKDEGGGHLFRNATQGEPRKFTWSGWIKRGTTGQYMRLFEANENNASNSHMLTFTTHYDDYLEVMARTNNSNQIFFRTTSWFRDMSAWYHIVLAVDTTLSSNTDKVKVYVNGQLQAGTHYVTIPNDYETAVNKLNVPHYIGSQGGGGSYLDGLIADVHFVDGVALAPTVFAGPNATTGVWDPIEFVNPSPVRMPATVTPTLLNGALIIKGNVTGSFSSGGGNLNYFTSSDGSSWTHVGSGLAYDVQTGSNYLAAGGAGTSPRTFNGHGNFQYLAWNTNTNFDQGSGHTTDVTGETFLDGPTSEYGDNGFRLNFDTLTSGGTDYTTGCSFSDNNAGKINGPFINMFDGNFQTRVSCSGLSGDAYNSMTINLPSTLSGEFRAYMRSETLYGTPRIKLFNGSTEVYNQVVNTGNSPGWHNFGNVTFNKIFFEVTLSAGAGSGADFYIWEINGQPLVNWDMTTNDEGTEGNTFKGRNINLADTHYYDDYGSGVDQYIPDQYTRTSNVNSIFTDDDQGIMVNWDGKNFIALTATSSTISLKYINYDGSSNNIPVATLHTNPGWTGNAIQSSSSSGSATNNDPITRNYAVSSGSKYYVRTGNVGPGGPMLLLYVTGATIATISESNPDYDVMFDSPTNGTKDGNDIGNYAVLNQVHKLGDPVINNGNLDVRWNAGNGHSVNSTIAMSSGKWYFEVNTGANACIGIRATHLNATNWPGSDTGSYGYATDGRKVFNSSYSSFGDAHQSTDIIGVAFDADAGKLWFSRNGVWQASGDPTNGTNPAFSSIPTSYTWYANVGYWTGNTSYINSVNFGQRPWGYAPPSGFKALCTKNLTDSSVPVSSTAFDVKLYSGNGGTQTISGLNLEGDLFWIKSKSNNHDNWLFNSVNGLTKAHYSNAQSAQYDYSPNGITATSNTGFTLTSTGQTFNANNDNLVSWIWDAGTSTVTNDAGSIDTQVRANQTAGFSIVTGTTPNTTTFTIGHGLGKVPSAIIVKSTNQPYHWDVYHHEMGNTTRLKLNTSDGPTTNETAVWGATDPTSSVFTMGGGGNWYSSGDQFVAFVMTEIEGFSKFGKYTGNGSNNGNFIYTGFRPHWIMIKNMTSSASWIIHDTERDPDNHANNQLYANNTNSEYNFTGNQKDILANGFKLRGNNNGQNDSNGNTQYIYFAFAESPLKIARAR